MEDLLITLSEPWAIRALIASSLVGIMCGILGCFIVLRNMSLIGDALSHAILPGVFFAFLLFGYSTIGFFIGSTIAGLLTAIIISWIQQNVKTKNDAAIGIIFTAMFSIGVIGISWLNQSEGVHLDLKDFLFGNILGISNEDIYLTLAITLYTIASVAIFYRSLFITTFQPTIAQTMGISVQAMHYFLMLLLSFAVVASLRTVGVILVVAMLITPAATALLLTNQLKRVISLAAFIGLLAAISGLLISIIFVTTPGPAMTIMATVFYFLAVFFAPEKGLLFKYLRNRREQSRVLREDIIKAILKSKGKGISISNIAMRIGFEANKVTSQAKDLIQSNLIKKDNGLLHLTEAGLQHGNQLIRAHRLWETYQVDQMGLQSDQIHEEAERMEHHLSSKDLLAIEEELGYPQNDPHGSPIPKQSNFYLNQIARGKSYRLLKEQISADIESFLWDKDLSFNDSFQLITKKEQFIQIKSNGKRISIPADMARQILVLDQ